MNFMTVTLIVLSLYAAEYLPIWQPRQRLNDARIQSNESDAAITGLSKIINYSSMDSLLICRCPGVFGWRFILAVGTRQAGVPRHDVRKRPDGGENGRKTL